MKQINVTMFVDDIGIMEETGGKTLTEAIALALQGLRDNRMYVEKWNYMEPEKELAQTSPEVPVESKSVYCLCEEFENDDIPREFQILAAGWDQAKLRDLMQAKIQHDEYGLIAENGVMYNDEDHFCTEFEVGFVEYYIREQKILSREELDLLISVEKDAAQEKEPGGKMPLASQIAGAQQVKNDRVQDAGHLNKKQTEQERG